MARPLILGILLCFSTGAFAQLLVPPAFDVATVKPVAVSQGLPPGFSVTPRRTGGRLTWTATRSWLVEYAYHLPSWRIVGVQSEPLFYVVEARMEESATEDQVRLMLQKLLQDRFKLSVHHETKELQGYRLLVAKSEPKIKAVPAQAEAPPLPDYLKGKPTAAFEDRIFVSAEGKGIGRFRLLSPELAAGIRRVKGLRRLGVRVGNWLTAEQGKRLLDATSDKGELAVIMATVIHALKCFCTSDETLRVHHQEFSQPRMGPGHSS